MSDSKRSDHWDLLASVLGAEPSKKESDEPAPQVEEKIPEVAKNLEVQAPTPPPPPEPVFRPSRSLSSWDALAVDLGIEVKPEPIAPPAPIRTPAPKQVDKKVFVQPDQQFEPVKPAAVEFIRQSDRFETHEPVESTESTEEPGEKKSRHRRRRRRKGKDKDPSAEMKKPSPGDGLETPTDSDRMDISLEIADQVETREIEKGPNEAEPEAQNQKHRRSRRGSRKRKKKVAETVQENSADVKKDDFPRRVESDDSTELPKVSDGEEDMIDDEPEEVGARGVKSGFRAIPTWEEAVGCIVSKNMESRPRRQGNGPPKSRPGGDSQKRRRK
jgi:hypothetical protein